MAKIFASSLALIFSMVSMVSMVSIALAETDRRFDFQCGGIAAGWELDIFTNTAQFRFNEKTIDFEAMDMTVAVGLDWPVALTFLAPNETAIVVLHHKNDEFTADILTQRRNLPVLLHGPCEAIQR